MPAPNAKQEMMEIPLKIVGGTHFGRYNKISLEETWNFIVSDGWLVPYAGYKNVLTLDTGLTGRGIYSSFNDTAMYGVLGSTLYRITAAPTGDTLFAQAKGTLSTSQGDVYIAENNNSEICVTDGSKVYVYNYNDNTFKISVPSGASGDQFNFPFTSPGYVSFQNGRLIIASTNTTNWVLSAFNNATSWPDDEQHVGSIQSKPDKCQAAVPMPGGGNNLVLFGRNVIELWQDFGLAKFPYQRNSSFNIDYGCLNPATIAHLKNYVVWLGVNEQSGPVLMVFIGNDFQSITTDGIDFQLSNLTNPENCTGFLYQQDGHVIYQFTFPDDNISYAYDFETKLFFTVSDENLNYHIAREVVYFNNTYYFVALNQGNVYEFDTLFTTAQYSDTDIKIIPRIRICPPLRFPDQLYYIGNSLGFTVENGQPNQIRNVPRNISTGIQITTEDEISITCENDDILVIEETAIQFYYEYASEQIGLAISRNGGETFGTFWYLPMNHTGRFMSRLIYQRLGIANDSTYQIRFNGFGRFVVTDGEVLVYR